MSQIKQKIDQWLDETILEEKIEDIVSERFGRYSKYIIQDRAIPDVRDGLKPVQRRILYAMYKLGMFADKPFKKSARIAGEVMGKYHPHGDSSIYEAMVRMSQFWKMRIPLIEMHGNNGSVDGDSAAAMRYTEARLTKHAELLLKDIDKRTIPLVPNFDDEELEPTVLPAKFPNILVNGSYGISAGYATKIPPHNPREIIKAVIERIDNPEMTVQQLARIIKGPDFPTGGIVQGREGIISALEKGSGRVIIRSKTSIEDMGKGQERIVISEIPYDVNKAELVKTIEQIRIDKKIDDLQEVRDESDRDGMRIAIELKKNANSDFVINYLFKSTDLQIAYNYNIVAIYNQRPVQMGFIPIIDAYINHQKEVVTNRSNFELARAQRRLHIVSGLMKMVSVIEEVIRLIRQSKNKADSKLKLIKAFQFSDEQAEAIVTLQLYRLSSTDIDELKKEYNHLMQTIERLNKILSNEKELLNVIKEELDASMKIITDKRRTDVEAEIETIKIAQSELVSDEKVIVAITKDGYVKRASVRSFMASKTEGLKDKDAILFQQELSTLNTLLIFTNLGNYIYLPVFKIEDQKWKDLGTYINNIVPLEPFERIIEVYSVSDFNEDKSLLLTTSNGNIKQTKLKDFEVSRYSKTIKAIKLNADDALQSVDIHTEPDQVIVLTQRGMVLRFNANDISHYGTTAGGVKAIQLNENDYIGAAFYTRAHHDYLLLTSRGNVKRGRVSEIPLSKRARAGIRLIREIKTNPHLIVSAVTMNPNQYKESVPIRIIAENTLQNAKAFDFKYGGSDNGRSVMNEKKAGTALFISIQDYEDEIPDDFMEEMIVLPKTSSSTEKKPNRKSDTVKESEPSIEDDKDNKDTEIHIHKLSLFDDDNES